MRTIATALLATLTSCVLMQKASAADMPLKAPPPPVLTWTGFYAGANIGYGWSNPHDVWFSPNDPAAAFGFTIGLQPPAISYRANGGLGGLQAGYNYQMGRSWLVGFETDFQWSGVKGSGVSFGNIGGGLPYSETVEERVKWFGTVRGRVGVLPTDNLLVFVTGGISYAKVEQSATLLPGNIGGGGGGVANIGGFSWVCFGTGTTPCFAGSSNRVRVDGVLGAGFEYRFLPNVTFKAEWLHMGLGSNAVTQTATQVFTPGLTPASFNANVGRTWLDVVRVGVNWQLGPR